MSLTLLNKRLLLILVTREISDDISSREQPFGCKPPHHYVQVAFRVRASYHESFQVLGTREHAISHNDKIVYYDHRALLVSCIANIREIWLEAHWRMMTT